jgi:hypothetical protein
VNSPMADPNIHYTKLWQECRNMHPANLEEARRIYESRRMPRYGIQQWWACG